MSASEFRTGDRVLLIRESLGVDADEEGWFVSNARNWYGDANNSIVELDSGVEVEVETDALERIG